VLLAEIEIRHSRAIAPTRRVALGELYLPSDPAPGFGGLLLAGIVAARIGELDLEGRADVDVLVDDLERKRRIPQPRLRHRFQTDVVGLDRSRHRLVGVGEALELELDEHGLALPQILGACYAAGRLSAKARPEVFRLLWRATRWEGDDRRHLLAWLSGDEAAFRVRRDVGHDLAWALGLLGFDTGASPDRTAVLRRFRQMVRDAHPDAGAEVEGAGVRITELAEARRLLTS
jgi:hypothetical protein